MKISNESLKQSRATLHFESRVDSHRHRRRMVREQYPRMSLNYEPCGYGGRGITGLINACEPLELPVDHLLSKLTELVVESGYTRVAYSVERCYANKLTTE